MVSGWSVFGLAHKTSAEPPAAAAPATSRAIAAPTAGAAVDQARASAQASPRQIRLGSVPLAAANDADGVTSGRRGIRVAGGGASEGPAASAQFQSRARSIGSRFRAAPPRPPAHRSEKLK
jgi:type IV secretion system protein VirB6